MINFCLFIISIVPTDIHPEYRTIKKAVAHVYVKCGNDLYLRELDVREELERNHWIVESAEVWTIPDKILLQNESIYRKMLCGELYVEVEKCGFAERDVLSRRPAWLSSLK